MTTPADAGPEDYRTADPDPISRISIAAFDAATTPAYRLAVGAVVTAALEGACRDAGEAVAAEAAKETQRRALAAGAHITKHTAGRILHAGLPQVASAIIYHAMIIDLAAQPDPDEELLAILARLAPIWSRSHRGHVVGAACALRRHLHQFGMSRPQELVLTTLASYANGGPPDAVHGRTAREGHRWLISDGRDYLEASTLAWRGLERVLERPRTKAP